MIKKLFAALILVATQVFADTPTINIVCAENVYGDTAKLIGGPYVQVSSILNNPAQDPHLFTLNPSTAILLTHTNIVVYNGADYDPWMHTLLTVKSDTPRQVIVVADLVGAHSGDNPHLWYLPKAMIAYATQLTQTLRMIDPPHAADYDQHLSEFLKNFQSLTQLIDHMKKDYENTPVIATEPLFGYMAQQLGLKMQAQDFQIKIMNDVPPSITQVKTFEQDLRQHRVRVLIYNNQVLNPMTKHMLTIAQASGIPIVGMSEMLPPEMHYLPWMIQQLTALENALRKPQT